MNDEPPDSGFIAHRSYFFILGHAPPRSRFLAWAAAAGADLLRRGDAARGGGTAGPAEGALAGRGPRREVPGRVRERRGVGPPPAGAVRGGPPGARLHGPQPAAALAARQPGRAG